MQGRLVAANPGQQLLVEGCVLRGKCRLFFLVQAEKGLSIGAEQSDRGVEKTGQIVADSLRVQGFIPPV